MPRLSLTLSLLLVASSTRAAGPGDRIEALAQEALVEHRAPGLAIGVAHHGTVVVAKGFGLADLENGVAVTADSAFPIASVTKNLTASAVLLLADEGKIALEDDIGKYLPEFPRRDEGVTLSRLLDNTAGIHSFTAIRSYWGQVGEPIEPSKLIEIFRDSPLDFPPGSKYSYSNSGYVLLGAVIEKAGGVSYADFLRSRLFAPLRMDRSVYCGTSEIVPGRVRGYSKKGSGFVNARHVDMSQGYAAGGVCSSVRDLLAWQAALHHGKVLPARTYAWMISPHRDRSYGLGIGVGSHGGHRVLYHAGGIGGFDAMVSHYPDDDLSIVVLANADGELAGELESRIARVLLAIPPPQAVPLSEVDRRRLVGTYSGSGAEVRLVQHEGSLTLRGVGPVPVPLIPIGGGVFAQPDSPELVALDGESVRVTHYGATRFEATRVH